MNGCVVSSASCKEKAALCPVPMCAGKGGERNEISPCSHASVIISVLGWCVRKVTLLLSAAGGEPASSILAGHVGDAAEGCDHLPPLARVAAQAAGRSREPQLALREPVALLPRPWGVELMDGMCICVLWSFQVLLGDSKSSARSQKLTMHLPEPALPE